MPNLMPIINSFNSGELSPNLDARTDLKKYYSGCRTLKNFIVTPYGGVVRRPGTYYVAETKHSAASQDKKSRLVPFEYNVEQAYILEFGEQYIRFYKDKGQIVYTDISFGADPSGDFAVGATMTGATSGATAIIVAKVSTQVYTIKYEQGTWTANEIINCGDKNVDCPANYPTTAASSDIVEVSSPYLEADLFDLHFVQSADVLYIVDNNGGYQPRKLSRLSHDHWTFEVIDFEWGPFLDDNTGDITITPPAAPSDVTTGETFSASDTYSVYTANKAFDDIVTGLSGWLADSAVINQWVKVQFVAQKTIKKIRIQPSVHIGYYYNVRHCKLQGSNDDSAWTDIPANKWTRFCSAYNTDEIELDYINNYSDWAEIEFNNSTAYTYYRLYCYDNWGASNYLGVKEIEMMEAVTNTYTSDAALFTSDHVGSIWKIAHQKTDNSQNDTISDTHANDPKTAITLKNTCRFRTTAHGVAATEYKIQRKYDDDPDWHNFKTLRGGTNYDLHWNEPVKDGASYRINCSAYTAGVISYTLSCEQNYDVSYVKIITFTDSTHVEALLIEGSEPPATATKLWAEGAWSDERGWPRTIGFFEGRVVYGGNVYNPLTLWFSETNNFEGMRAKTKAENENFDDDALIFTISAAQQNMLRWIIGQEALLVGTAGSEGKLSSYNRTEPLTPENIPEYRNQSSYGSSSIQPIIFNDAIFFVQRENKRIREFMYNFDADIFIARDKTIFAEHITGDGIVQMTFQKQPSSILWAVRDDGVLLGMGYERLEDIYGWFRVVTDGEIESCEVISSAGQTTKEDEVWLIVKRTIGGNTKRYVEYMKPRDWGSTDTDVFFVDSGLSASGSDGNTYIGGLDHLEGETADILIDGKVGDQQEVGTGNGNTTGYVDLKIGGVAAASTVKLHVGLNYESDLQPMKLEIPLGEMGTARGREKRIHEIVISFKDTLGGYFGRNAANLDELDDAVTGTSGSMTSLKTMEVVSSFPGLDGISGNIFIRQSYPLPMTVRALAPKFSISEI